MNLSKNFGLAPWKRSLSLVLLGCLFSATCHAESEGSQVLNNFVLLMKSSWKDTAIFAGWFIFKVVAGFAVGAGIGMLAGIFFYQVLHQRALFDSSWRWYRFAKWFWAPAFVVTLAVAMGYAGAWVSGGRALNRAIKEDHVVRKVVANLCAAVALNELGYRVAGTESAAQIMEFISSGQELAQTTLEHMGSYVRSVLEAHQESSGSKSRIDKFLLRLIANQDLGRRFFAELLEVDSRLAIAAIILFAADHPGLAAAVDENPEGAAVKAVVAMLFEKLEKEIISQINWIVLGNVLLAILIGLALPGGSLALFRGAQRAFPPRPPALPENAPLCR